MNEITIKDLYDIIDKRFTGLEAKVEKYHDSFVHFEEGKLTQALQDIEALKADVKENKSASERRKDWIWGAAEKIIFAIIGALLFVAGLVLEKLGIINLH